MCNPAGATTLLLPTPAAFSLPRATVPSVLRVNFKPYRKLSANGPKAHTGDHMTGAARSSIEAECNKSALTAHWVRSESRFLLLPPEASGYTRPHGLVGHAVTWSKKRAEAMKAISVGAGIMCVAVTAWAQGSGAGTGHELEGKRLFDQVTFGGNGRTCQTCHSEATGTVSPADAQKRFQKDPADPLFRHDGSDDGLGHGVSRMLADATILVTIPLPFNVRLADDPTARSVVLRRGIPTTTNTPALDPVLMSDGRQPTLEAQAASAIRDHADGVIVPPADLQSIAAYEKTNAFFSSPELRRFALDRGQAPELTPGQTASEKRGRVFFEDSPPDPTKGLRPGLCAHCHSGPLLNQTNRFAKEFLGLPIPAGQRFISVGVSELNKANNAMREYIFNPGTVDEQHLISPDPGRALITGIGPASDPLAANTNAFKISALRGIEKTAPYFHDNSAKTLEDVAAHYTLFFNFVTGGAIQLTKQDEQDIVAYLKLLK
jgi:cytochrome c peroxidase